jgi:hypothetical protein
VSPHEGDEDIEQEDTEEVEDIESSGDGQDDREAVEVLGLSLRQVRGLFAARERRVL